MSALLVGAAVALTVAGLSGWAPAPRVPGRVAEPARRPTLADLVGAATRVIDRVRPDRRRARRDAQLPDALDRLGSAIRSGQAVGPALATMADALPDPLGAELRPVAGALRHGASVGAALGTWATGAGASSDVRLVAAALTLGADAGGEVARAVDRIAATLRERRELQAEVRALATQARASAGVLAVAPLAFAGLVATVEPAVAAFLITTPVGWASLTIGLGLEALGALWMARITRSAV